MNIQIKPMAKNFFFLEYAGGLRIIANGKEITLEYSNANAWTL
jgi:hypothetical protein